MTNYLRALRYLHMLRKRAYWPRTKLAKYQDRKLKAIVRYAYDKVPLYRQKFREAHVNPADIKTQADLHQLPIIEKRDIRTDPTHALSMDMNPDALKVVHTSGSTGQPLQIYITPAEDEYRKAKHLRANISCGQRPRDRWVTITRRFEPAGRIQRLFGIYTPHAVSVFDSVDRQLAAIEALQPDLLDGYSNSLLLLAKELAYRQRTTIHPRLTIGGAELLAASQRATIEHAFGVPFYDQYAIIELERVAWQCPQQTGYHIDADSIIVEFVDETGELVAPGETGQIICTSLFNQAMPFIRYDVGDLGSASTEPQCACGRTFPLMNMVEGRKGAFLSFPDGRVLAPFAFIGAIMAFRHYQQIDLFRVVQRKPHVLVVKIKLADARVDRQRFEQELVSHLMHVFKLSGSPMEVHIEFVEDFALDRSGKFSIVVSEIA